MALHPPAPVTPGGSSNGTRVVLSAINCVVAALSLSWLIWQVALYHVDVPFWDEWLLLPLIASLQRGELTIAPLLAPHNEHIPFFPRVVLLGLAQLTGWNLAYECAANVVLAIVSTIPLWLTIRRWGPRAPVERHLAYATLVVLQFSMNQWENWTWGWQLEVFLNQAAVNWAVFLWAAGPRLPRVLAASACGVIATFSFGNGILVWLATLPVVWVNGRHRRATLALWGVTALGTVAFYLFRVRQMLPEVRDGIDVLRMVEVALRVVGSSLVAYLDDGRFASTAGLAGTLVAALVVGIHARDSGTRWLGSPWFALLCYAVGTAVLLGIGRQVPVNETIPSRYLTFANIFWLAVVLLCSRWRKAMAALACIVVPMTTVTALQAHKLYTHRKASLVSARATLYAPLDNPLLSRFFWDRNVVLGLLADLRDLRLSLYDCESQLSWSDWQNAARTIQKYARPGDIVVTSSDWAAECIGEPLEGAAPALSIVSGGETEEHARSAVEGRGAAFLISGGDVRGFGARAWIETHGFPLYRSPVGSMRLFFYPDRTAFVRQRLTLEDVRTDNRVLVGSPDLLATAGERFFLHGWSRPAAGDRGYSRALLDRHGTLYVPVVRQVPQVLLLEGRKSPVLASLPGENGLDVSVNGVSLGTFPFDGENLRVEVQVASAFWQPGGNILSLELRQVPQGELNRDDLALLEIHHLTIE